MPSGLSSLPLVDPQHATDWVHDAVPAARPSSFGSTPRPVEVEFAGAGRMWSLEEWRDATYSTSLVVVDRSSADATVVCEWYAHGLGPQTLFLGASMSKSVLAHLVGRAVGAGSLSLNDRVGDRVPELGGSAYADCSVRHLLTMTSGVDWVEDYRDPASVANRLLARFHDGRGGSRDLLAAVGRRVEPGRTWAYCTADSQVLDWVREAATGQRHAEALADLWRALGCENPAAVATDAPDGVALAGGGVAATARDWARVALLQLNGTLDGRRVLDEEWVDAASTPPAAYLEPGRLPSSITTHAGFGWHWWPLDGTGRRVTADGSRGQFAYADRDRGVVVVKTSRWPYDDALVDRQLRDLSYLALPVVAEAAAQVRPAELFERKVRP